MKQVIKRCLPPAMKSFLTRSLDAYRMHHAVHLPPPAGAQQTRKRALLSYVTAPFRQRNETTQPFTYAGIPKLIARTLHDLGYAVDVIDWDNTVFAPQTEYDLFVGHAGRNFEQIAAALRQDCIKIYFSTGTYWREHNRREEERFAGLEQRRGKRLPYDRWIGSSEEEANRTADGIICLGNQVARDSYHDFPVVINLNNATYNKQCIPVQSKDHASARHNFLFFSSHGNVHKGLDLLLEAFSQIDAHLYVCQVISPEFLTLYRHELEETPNIHLMGYVELQSEMFRTLADQCSFVIHPSCAEGQPGAVLDCMGCGLIPVLTRENNIDVAECGFLVGASVEAIRDTVQRLSQLPVSECRRLSEKAREIVSDDYSEETFYVHMKAALQKILTVGVEQRALPVRRTQ